MKKDGLRAIQLKEYNEKGYLVPSIFYLQRQLKKLNLMFLKTKYYLQMAAHIM